jgi:capsular polysaccharide transport system permease protein
MIPLSGSFFMLHSLPEGFRAVLLWIPTVSCAELVREGYFGPTVKSYYDVGYVIFFNLVVMLVALVQIRVVSRNITPA